ncbi:MAG: hypothetical protein JSR33_09125 [Proteobacteria bacterium]|nr:hypothetical protein [Pseudomonadota bacterium]
MAECCLQWRKYSAKVIQPVAFYFSIARQRDSAHIRHLQVANSSRCRAA